jgi:L-cysteine desulfidase
MMGRAKIFQNENKNKAQIKHQNSNINKLQVDAEVYITEKKLVHKKESNSNKLMKNDKYKASEFLAHLIREDSLFFQCLLEKIELCNLAMTDYILKKKINSKGEQIKIRNERDRKIREELQDQKELERKMEEVLKKTNLTLDNIKKSKEQTRFRGTKQVQISQAIKKDK